MKVLFYFRTMDLFNLHFTSIFYSFYSLCVKVSFWFISALWGVICGLPHYIGLTSADIGSKSSLFFGTAVYAAGLLIETLADYQKWAFKKSNPRKFCNVGLVRSLL
jgi:steroid 5-alpha reductase family enzyme